MMSRRATHISIALLVSLVAGLSFVSPVRAQMATRAEIGLSVMLQDTLLKQPFRYPATAEPVADLNTAPILLKSSHAPTLALNSSDNHVEGTAPEGFCCATPNFGMTMLMVVGLEAIPNYFNWRVSDDSTAILSLDSFKHNMVKGMEWDHNAFTTNMFAHPYHGNVYFNSGRANGYSFWASSFFAGLGSFVWEMYGENNRGAINDWIMTSIGGIAVGETLHRSAKLLRNHEQTGIGRSLREFGAFLIDPVSGLNRAIRGETSKVGKNFEDRFPKSGGIQMTVGYRQLGGARPDDPGTPTADTTATPYVDMTMIYGDFMYDHDRPFDSFRFAVQANFSDKVPIGRMSVRGTLWGRNLKDEENVKHALTFDQQFLYLENQVVETGGQFFGVSLYSRWKLSKTWGLSTHVQPLFALLTGINSEYGDLTGRSYDFGTGAALQLAGVLSYKGYPVFRAAVVDIFSGTINGAKGRHNLLIPALQGRIKVAKSVGLGFDWYSLIRNSYYDDFRLPDGTIVELPDVSRYTPTFRLNVTFSWFTQVTGRD